MCVRARLYVCTSMCVRAYMHLRACADVFLFEYSSTVASDSNGTVV